MLSRLTFTIGLLAVLAHSVDIPTGYGPFVTFFVGDQFCTNEGYQNATFKPIDLGLLPRSGSEAFPTVSGSYNIPEYQKGANSVSVPEYCTFGISLKPGNGDIDRSGNHLDRSKPAKNLLRDCRHEDCGGQWYGLEDGANFDGDLSCWTNDKGLANFDWIIEITCDIWRRGT